MASRLPKILFFFLLLPIALGLAGWQGWAWWSWATSPIVPETTAEGDGAIAAEPVQIQIPQGTPGQQIGRDLEAAGLIRSHVAWNLWSRWQSWQQDMGYQAGTYALSPTQSLQEIADQIRTGEVLETTFTIPEGWTREQMAAAFEERGMFSAQDFFGSHPGSAPRSLSLAARHAALRGIPLSRHLRSARRNHHARGHPRPDARAV